MNNIQWLDAMSVGIKEFDDDHKAFFTTLFDLDDALIADEVEKALQLAIALRDLVKDHGAREAEFLRQNGFPQLQQILDAHSLALERTEKLLSLVKMDPQTAARTIFEMQNNLMTYLMDGDLNYRYFIKEIQGNRDSGAPVRS